MIKFYEQEYLGDLHVLAGFFKYHNAKSSPPEVFNSNDNHHLFYETIDVDAIGYIIKQRNWKLPHLNFNPIQSLIEKFTGNKSPDFLPSIYNLVKQL